MQEKACLTIDLFSMDMMIEIKSQFYMAKVKHTSERLSTTSKEGLKDVKWIVGGTTSSHSLLESIFSILVVHISFLRVT
jgi:hypothetical protein